MDDPLPSEGVGSFSGLEHSNVFQNQARKRELGSRSQGLFAVMPAYPKDNQIQTFLKCVLTHWNSASRCLLRLPAGNPLPASFSGIESFSSFFFLVFLSPHPQHTEVPRPGVESELRLPAYSTATAIQDPSRVYNLHHSSQQCQTGIESEHLVSFTRPQSPGWLLLRLLIEPQRRARRGWLLSRGHLL